MKLPEIVSNGKEEKNDIDSFVSSMRQKNGYARKRGNSIYCLFWPMVSAAIHFGCYKKALFWVLPNCNILSFFGLVVSKNLAL